MNFYEFLCCMALTSFANYENKLKCPIIYDSYLYDF